MNTVFFIGLVIYFAATVVQFIGVALKKEKLTKAAHFIFLAGFFFHTLYTVWRGITAGRVPLANQFEFASGFAWAAAVMGFAMYRYLKQEWCLTAAMPITFLVLSYAAFQPMEIRDLMPALRSTWFVLHIGSAAFSYASFAIAAGMGVYYLLQVRKTEGGRQSGSASVSKAGKAGDSLQEARLRQIDYLSYRMICLGFLLLTVVIFSGAIWAEQAWSSWWSWDPKETWALITWIFYSIYLHQRLRMKWQGKRMAWLAIIAFILVLFTFAGVNTLLPGLHSYAT